MMMMDVVKYVIGNSYKTPPHHLRPTRFPPAQKESFIITWSARKSSLNLGPKRIFC